MAYILLALTALFWSGNFILGRAMHLILPPIVMAELRWLLAMILILPFLLPKLIRDKAIIVKHWKILTLLSILSVACFNTFIYIGLTSTTASNATILQSVIPVVILIISAIWLREPISIQQWIGVIISLFGVLTLLTMGNPTSLLSFKFNQGDLFILVAVIAWAIYSILLRWRPADLDGFTFFGITVIIGAIVLLPFALFELQHAEPVVLHNQTIATIIYMAIFPSILAYLFWNKGVAELGAAKAGLFIHLMPIFGLILSSLFLKEQIQRYHLIGVLFIFIGIYLAVISKKNNPKKNSPKKTMQRK